MLILYWALLGKPWYTHLIIVYTSIRQQDIFVCQGDQVRLTNHSGINPCFVLIGKLVTLPV